MRLIILDDLNIFFLSQFKKKINFCKVIIEYILNTIGHNLNEVSIPMHKMYPLNDIINYNIIQTIFCSTSLLLLHLLILIILTTSLVYSCFVLCKIAQFVMFEISMTSFISSFPISYNYDLATSHQHTPYFHPK